MSDHLKELLGKAREAEKSANREAVRERQRVSFVYGSLKIEDAGVTERSVADTSREMHRKEARHAAAGRSDGRADVPPAPE